MDEISEIELAVRKVVAVEVREYRTFLQNQLKYITWSVSIIVLTAGIIFAYFFGNSIQESKDQLKREVTSKIVEYRINEDLKKRVQISIDIAVKNVVDSNKMRERIHKLIKNKSDAIMKAASNSIEKRLVTSIRREIKEASNLKFSDLLKKTGLRAGFVVAFNGQTCPIGWKPYKSASGRMLVGAGKNRGLTSRSVGDNGGTETHSLTTDEMPRHNHNIIRTDSTSGSGNYVRWDVMGGVNNKGVGMGTSSAGEGKAHNNMPPYIVLLYCIKK